MGYLDQNARAVTSIGLTATSTAMAHPLQHGYSIENELMRLAGFFVGDKSDSA